MTLIYGVLWFNLIVILFLAGYPLFVYIKSLLVKNPVDKSVDFECPVSIIIAVWNEEHYIKQKMESLLDSKEWIEGSEIIVVSGGSSDGTNKILQEYNDVETVTFIPYPDRLSKIVGVNMAVELAKHELLVFSDCRQIMKPNSIRKLIQNFADPEIGTVTSTLIDHNGGRYSMRNILNFISRCESISGSSLNIFGALYAQRKSVFRPFPESILFDDVFAVVSTLNQGKRLISEKEAVIYDVPFNEYYQAERIGRLTNGLLIFLVSKYKMIFKLPPNILSRFLIFKYLKFLLPFVFMSSLICLGMAFFPFLSQYHPLFICVLGMIILVIPTIRQVFLHLLKVNFYFLTSTVKFIFEKKHSTEWKKLDKTIAKGRPISS